MASVAEQNVDWGDSGRVDWYTAKTVDPFTLTELDQVYLKESASSVTYSYGSENHMQATIDLAEGDYLQNPIESGMGVPGGSQQRMVRLYHHVSVGSFSNSYCMGTFFVANLTNNSLYGRQQRKLSCYGPMYRFSQDYMAEDFIRSAGSNCVDNIRYIIEQHGGTLTLSSEVDASRTHTVDVNIPVGFNLAEALNIYSGWIGCEMVSGDDGTLQLRKYVAPRDRSPVYTFEEGANCVYLPGIEFEVNRDEPVNRVIAYFSRERKQDDPSKDNYDPYPLSDSCHVELNPASSFSYENCGRYRTQVMQVSEPCSHEELVAQAQRALDESSASILYLNIEHAGIPWLRVGDCVRYVNNRDQGKVNVTTAIIEEMSVQSLGPLCMTKTKLRCYL